MIIYYLNFDYTVYNHAIKYIMKTLCTYAYVISTLVDVIISE